MIDLNADQLGRLREFIAGLNRTTRETNIALFNPATAMIDNQQVEIRALHPTVGADDSEATPDYVVSFWNGP